LRVEFLHNCDVCLLLAAGCSSPIPWRCWCHAAFRSISTRSLPMVNRPSVRPLRAASMYDSCQHIHIQPARLSKINQRRYSVTRYIKGDHQAAVQLPDNEPAEMVTGIIMTATIYKYHDSHMLHRGRCRASACRAARQVE